MSKMQERMGEKTEMINQYKFLRKGMKSEHSNLTWKLNKWVKVEGELELCNNGLHSCKEPYDAFSYVRGEILAIVECRGEHLSDENKYCWREQRVIKTYRWTKKDSVRLAIYSAEQVLSIYEKKYPKDKRPRRAIEAANRYLKSGSRKGLLEARYAAYAAADAHAAYAAYAAYAAAAYAAADAAYAAYAAADAADAAHAAYAAAAYADAAYAYAAYAAAARKLLIIKKIQKYFLKIVKEKINAKN